MSQADARGKRSAKRITCYEAFDGEVSDAITPCVRALARCMRGTEFTAADEAIVATLARDYAAEHVASSLADLDAATESGDVSGLADLWTTERAPRQAAAIMDRAIDLLWEPS